MRSTKAHARILPCLVFVALGGCSARVPFGELYGDAGIGGGSPDLPPDTDLCTANGCPDAAKLPGQRCPESACASGTREGNLQCPDGATLSRTECIADQQGACHWEFPACAFTPPTCAIDSCQVVSTRADSADATAVNYCWTEADQALSKGAMAASSRGLQSSVFVSELNQQNRVECQYIGNDAEFCNRCTLDANGNETLCVSERLGVETGRTEYRTTSTDGVVTTEMKTDSGEWMKVRSREFDASGRLIRKILYETGGVVGPETTYDRDSQGRIVTSTTILGDGWQHGVSTNTERYIYDDQGRLTEISTRDSGGTESSKETWTYEGGRLVTHERWADAQMVNDGPSYTTRYTDTFSTGCQQYQTRYGQIFGVPTDR